MIAGPRRRVRGGDRAPGRLRALLIAATTWPAYLLGVLGFSHETAERLERAVMRTSLALLVAAAGAMVFLLVEGC